MTGTLYKSKQQVFDKVWKHFVIDKNPKSEVPRVGKRPVCQYGGTGCAIGCLIDDKLMCTNWDGLGEAGLTINSIFYKRPEQFGMVFANPGIGAMNYWFPFLTQLQWAHDDFNGGRINAAKDFTSHITERLKELATEHKLEIPK